MLGSDKIICITLHSYKVISSGVFWRRYEYWQMLCAFQQNILFPDDDKQINDWLGSRGYCETFESFEFCSSFLAQVYNINIAHILIWYIYRTVPKRNCAKRETIFFLTSHLPLTDKHQLFQIDRIFRPRVSINKIIKCSTYRYW